MFKRFIRQKANQTPPNATPAPAPENDRLAMAGLRQPELAQTLLSTPRRQRLLEHIWQRTSLPRPQFGWLYLAPLQRYAELVQQLCSSSPLPTRTTTLAPAACSTTAWRSLPMR